MNRIEKLINYFGIADARVACDGNCSKAWGINNRPRIELSDDPEDYVSLSDDELGIAPTNPGTYEGRNGKPLSVTGPDDINRWCVRECERMVMSAPGEQDEPLELPDFTKRFYNLSSSEP